MALIDVGRPTLDGTDPQPPPFTSPLPGPAPRVPSTLPATTYNPLQGAQQATGGAFTPSADTGYAQAAVRRPGDETGDGTGGVPPTTRPPPAGGVDLSQRPTTDLVAAAYRQYLGREGAPQ